MKGNRSLIWLIPPTLLAAYVGLFTPPASYNGKFFSYGFNPHLGYINELAPPEYTNAIHSIHNVFLFVSLTGLYLVFCIVMMIKYAAFGQSTIKNIRHKWNFLQVALISAVNATAAAVYVFAIYWHVNAFIIIVGHYCWILAHGMPCVIYMTMNHTIREQFRQMLLGIMPKSGRVSTIASSGTLSRASDLPPRDGSDRY
ncbi:Protein SRT-41 [Aphelenchoides avenae]|nr:Protein SRT-41 [Aphelenchus avenae]